MALTEKNIYYETLVVVENLVGVCLSSSQIFFTSCCGSWSWPLISAPVLRRMLLGKDSCPNGECPGVTTPAQHGLEPCLSCRGTKALLCTDCCVTDVSGFLEGSGWGLIPSESTFLLSFSFFHILLSSPPYRFFRMCTLTKFFAREFSFHSLLLGNLTYDRD